MPDRMTENVPGSAAALQACHSRPRGIESKSAEHTLASAGFRVH